MRRFLWSPRQAVTVVWPRVAPVERMRNGWFRLTGCADESNVPTAALGLRVPCPSRHLLQPGPPTGHRPLVLPKLPKGRGCYGSI